MTIGERIKKIRVFRKMTMDMLVGASDFEWKTMSVHIFQYETATRISGKTMLLKLADTLHFIPKQFLITAPMLTKISLKHFSGFILLE